MTDDVREAMDDFFDEEGRAEEAEVSVSVDLPLAYIHNDKDGKGRGGGLLIKADAMPENAIINRDKVEEVEVEYDDPESPTKIKKEKAFLIKEYSLCIIHYDHDESGKPWASKQAFGNKKPSWAFYVVANINECWSPDIPFRIKYGGATNAIRMSEHVRNFFRWVVNEASAIKVKAGKPKATYNQFLLPVRHAPEFVGEPPDSSWVAAVQEYEEKGLVKKPRRGVSTLKKFADDHSLLKKLYLPKRPDGVERVRKTVEWIREYKDAVTVVSSEHVGSSEDGENKSESRQGGRLFHFTDNEKYSASEKQIGKITELAGEVGVDPDKELQILRESTTLKGGNRDSTIFALSKDGASILIDHLLEKKNSGPKAAGASAGSGEKKRPEPITDDDIPF